MNPTPKTGPDLRLSVLVPAYRYPAGVARILAGLHPWPAEVEVVVSDDSPDDAVAKVVEQFRVRHAEAGPLQLLSNRPARGAVPNWNALLDAACGTHVWLLHHDEFPIGAHFTRRLLDRLAREDAPDVLLLDCLLADPDSGRNRRHLPLALRAAVLRHAPGYLLRRNAIGPVSSLVMRREHCPRFDPALKWLVDVDFYLRLLSQPGLRVAAVSDLAIGSVLGREGSITAALKDGLAQRERDEHRWLCDERGLRTLWLADPRSGSASQRAALAAEGLAWKLWRAATRLPALLGWSARPPAELRAALQPPAAGHEGSAP